MLHPQNMQNNNQDPCAPVLASSIGLSIIFACTGSVMGVKGFRLSDEQGAYTIHSLWEYFRYDDRPMINAKREPGSLRTCAGFHELASTNRPIHYSFACTGSVMGVNGWDITEELTLFMCCVDIFVMMVYP